MPKAPGTSDHRVVVVGGGIAGLVSALELSLAGLPVTVLERGATIGGKLHQRMVNGIGIDSGPTVFTMRWIFDALFEKAGTRLDDELQCVQTDILARHAWSASERFDLYADRGRSIQEVERFAGSAEAMRFEQFCELARTAYRTLEAAYIRSERPSLASMNADLGLSGLSVLWRLGLFQSLWSSLHRHFKDPRLHQLFSRYATYCGSSPLHAPATLMLIADVEMQGVWRIEGGMSALAQSIAGLAQHHGAQIRTDCDVTRIVVEHDRVTGVQFNHGETIAADSVIFNGDVAALRNGAIGLGSARSTAAHDGPSAAVAHHATGNPFGAPEDDLAKRSLSALTYSMHARTQGFPLVYHNLFFNQDYEREFSDIFTHRRLPRHPTVYVCAQDRRDDDRALNGPERLLLLINAPATGDRPSLTDSEIEQCTQAGFSLMQRCGLSIDHTESNTVITTPTDFHRRFPATGGALYGHATHGWMQAFSRPGTTTPIDGLYLAGGSVHPGPGVPMAAMSGRLAAATLMGHLGLTKPSRRVVISGGTSTR